jgi:hypothetical protein
MTAAAPAGSDDARLADRLARRGREPRAPMDANPRWRVQHPGAEPALHTRHGGLFFLLNAALALGWYGDFSQPLAPCLALSPWRWMHDCGRRSGGGAFAVDPLSAWLRRRGAAGAAAAASPIQPTDRLDAHDQLALCWPLLRARLVLALGWPDSTSARRAALRLVCDLPARLAPSAARVDLHFSLAALPLAVRLAGLDRDPGWIPAAGCDIRFHFD